MGPMRWRGPDAMATSPAIPEAFHAATRRWFEDNFPAPTAVQQAGWNRIVAGSHSLLVAPTGSGKTLAAFLAGIDRLGGERPVLIGTSRKRFLETILDRAGRVSGPEDRDSATLATVALAIAGGASVVRVHDVVGTADAARTADAIVRVHE